MEHAIQEASLERFAAGIASQEESRAITRHLLKGCSLCAERLRGILRPSVAAADYGPALDAFMKLCLGQPRGPEESRPPAAGPSPSPRKRQGPRPWH